MTTNPLPPRRASGPASHRARVLFLLTEYPRAGQTAIKNEIEALEADYEIGILARRTPVQAYANHRPHALVRDLEDCIAAVEAFQPDLIHAHFLTELGFVGEVARRTGVPFTLRAHSFDTLALRPPGLGGRIAGLLRGAPPQSRAQWLREGLAAMESELCLGVLALPFARPWLIRAGACEAKVVDCFPVMRFAQFHDSGPNGDAVMNVGICATKRAMPDFLRLGRRVPERSFNLYAMDQRTDWLKQRSAENGAGVNFVGPIEPEAMPREYKRHRWLVYTADADAPGVGWPVAIAEAQAAGVGVCMPALRRDLAQYVGEGAGILYESVDELPAIVSAPVPEEMRERGFAQARKSDIERHKHLLTDLWDDALRARAPDMLARGSASTGAGGTTSGSAAATPRSVVSPA